MYSTKFCFLTNFIDITAWFTLVFLYSFVTLIRELGIIHCPSVMFLMIYEIIKKKIKCKIF